MRKLASGATSPQNGRVSFAVAATGKGHFAIGEPPKAQGGLDRGPLLAPPFVGEKARVRRILRVRAATFPRRMAASLVDLGFVSSVSAAVAVLAALALGAHLPSSKELGADYLMAGLLDRNPMVIGALGLFFGISGLYQIYLSGISGQTLGKRLLGIRVISSQGQAPGPLLAGVRFLAMVVSGLLLGLGWLWCIFDRERRALHDHLSKSYVIVDEVGEADRAEHG